MNKLSGAGVSGGASPSSARPVGEIVGAVVVMALAAEKLVAPAVAGGEQGVVDAARSVFDQGQDRPPPVGDERVADRREDMPDRDAAVLHRHELAQIGGIERPGVDDLLARRVDYFDDLAATQMRSLALARRDLDHLAPPSPRQRANVAEIAAAAVYLLAAGTSIGAQFDRPDIRQSSRFDSLRNAFTR